MIQIDMPMPESCYYCRFVDSEFMYCHARSPHQHWDVWEEERYEKGKPDWCPLIEVKNAKTNSQYDFRTNNINSVINIQEEIISDWY